MDSPQKDPDVVVCLLPRKLKNLGICLEMGEHALRMLEQYPNIELIRDDVVFISNKIPSHVVYAVADAITYIEQNNYSDILLLVPQLAKHAPSQKFYGDIINKLSKGNYHVQTIECVV